MDALDRANVIHGLGARDLSPAVRGGAPALAEEGDREGRCGWADFFAALEARGQRVVLEEGGARIVDGPAPARPAEGRPALEEAKAFLRALRGR